MISHGFRIRFPALVRAVIQRVSSASVEVSGETIASQGPGLLILLGIEEADSEDDGSWLVKKISRMRIFEDRDGKMNESILDVKGDATVVSQFTLHASTRKGNRPSFIKAAPPAHSEPLYEGFCLELQKELGRKVETGRFGAMMKVSLVNDGPVTIIIDSKNPE